MQLGGQRLVDRLLGQVPEYVPVVIVGPALDGLSRTVAVVREEPPGSGPLAAIGAGVAAVETDLVAVLAVDMPFAVAVVAEAISRLSRCADTSAMLPTDPDGFPQTLCGGYRAAALREAVHASAPLADRAVKTLLPHLRYRTWSVRADDVADVDTPEQLERARRRVLVHMKGAAGVHA